MSVFLCFFQHSSPPSVSSSIQEQGNTPKKPFLRRGQGIARFGVKNPKIKPQRVKPKMTKPQTCLNSDNPPSGLSSNQCVTIRQPMYSPQWGPIPEHPEHEHTGARIQRSLSQGSLDSTAEVTQKSTRVRKVARSQSGDIYGSTESLPQVIPLCRKDSHTHIIGCIVRDYRAMLYTVHMYLNHIFLPFCRLH